MFIKGSVLYRFILNVILQSSSSIVLIQSIEFERYKINHDSI